MSISCDFVIIRAGIVSIKCRYFDSFDYRLKTLYFPKERAQSHFSFQETLFLYYAAEQEMYCK